MKIDEYGYTVSNIGKFSSDSSNYQDFSTYPLRCKLPQLKSDNMALHYCVSLHGNQYIVIKENNLSIHVITNMWPNTRDRQISQFPNRFIAPFFIEKTKAYRINDHTQYVFTALFQKIELVNKNYDKSYINHPYRELENYCKKHFGFIDFTARTEIEAGR